MMRERERERARARRERERERERTERDADRSVGLRRLPISIRRDISRGASSSMKFFIKLFLSLTA
jgi:hypothetical protein